MIKIRKSWIIIGAVVLIIVGYFAVKSFLKNPIDSYITEKASKGEVSQEISETGSVKATENLNLGFKITGKIARVDVSVGDSVRKGDILAELNLAQLSSQQRNAQAALDVAKNQYDKLLRGAISEDIKIYEDAVISAQHDLDSAQNSSVNVLNDAYTKIYNSYTAAISIKSSYFSASDQEGIKVQDSVSNINENMQSAKSQMAASLNNVYNDLKIIREQCDQGVYYSRVSSADKATLDAHKGYINTALTNVTNSQQEINSYKIALQKAKDNLSLQTAGPRQEDIDIYRAQMQQAQANLDSYQSQTNDGYLRSPINGRITEINAKRGETVSPGSSVINLLSSEPFQIKANIYEQDIVNVKQSDVVKISLVAFPKQTFEGKVIAIYPAEKIIDNVVYYEVTIDFPNQPEGIKSGMTADIVIETNKKEDVLRISKSAVENIDGKEIVQIANKKKIEDRQITTGLEGNDFVEVLSGLSEGDEIVIGKK